MRYSRLRLFAALAVLAIPLAIPAQVLAGPSSASSGKCKLAPTMSMQKTKASDCGGPFVAGTAVSKVKTVERIAPASADNVIVKGDTSATAEFAPPADPVAEKLKSTGGKSELTSAEPSFIGSDRLFVCTAGASEPTSFDSVMRAVGTELPLGPQPCQRRTSAL